MTARHFVWLGCAGLALATLTGVATHAARQQRHERDALAARIHLLETEAATLKTAVSLALEEVAQAEAQLAKLPEVKKNPGEFETKASTGDWLARVKRLRTFFAENPDQRIPEMNLLNDADWLRAAATGRWGNDDDLRATLASIRTVAVGRFKPQISSAIRKYATDPAAPRPASASALAPYFETPVDLSMLTRYEIVDRPRNLGSGTGWAVRNKEAVDPAHDSRVYVNDHGAITQPYSSSLHRQ